MTQYCLTCGEPYEGKHEDSDFIVLYAYCDTCGEKTTFGSKGQLEASSG